MRHVAESNFSDINDLLIWNFCIIPSIVTLFGTCPLPFNASRLSPRKAFQKLRRDQDKINRWLCSGTSPSCSGSFVWLLVIRPLVSPFVACRRLVEINPDPFIPRVGPATSATFPTSSQHVLAGQYPRRTRHIRTYPCLGARRPAWWPRHHGSARGHVCQCVDPRRSASSHPGVLDVGRVGTYGQGATREHVPRQHDRRRMGEHGRGRGMCDWYMDTRCTRWSG